MEPEDAVIVVELYCEGQKRCERKPLQFDSFPSTFGEIKKKVEDSLSIPACVQTLFYQEVEMKDSCDPSSMYMISGDTVRITFPERGDCKEVKEVVEWLSKVTPVMKMYEKADEVDKILQITRSYASVLEDNTLIDTLIGVLFYPWSEKTKRVNCSHFVALDGLELLVTLHRHSVTVRRFPFIDETHYFSQLYELICCQAIANFAMDFTCRRMLTKLGGLEQCMESFLIHRISDDGHLSTQCYNIVTMALYAVCNISELPEVQQSISEKEDIIGQVLAIAKCDRFDCRTAVMDISLLLCLAQCPEAHANLLRPSIVDQIIEACSIRCNEPDQMVDEVCTLETYSAITLAQMVCGSCSKLQTFPVSCLENMYSLMDKILCYDPETVRSYEISNGLVWRTFLPYFDFLYSPESDLCAASGEASYSLIKKVHHCSYMVLLRCLEICFGREIHVDTMIEENLLEFLLAMSGNVGPEFEEKASDVRRVVSKFCQLQPPSLVSLAKAKLAKSKWGLKTMREMHSVSHFLSLQ